MQMTHEDPLMKTAISILTVFAVMTVAPLSAQAEEQMCKVSDPNDTSVNLRYPPNGELMRSLPNGSWIWVDPNGTEYDQQRRPWVAALYQRTKSPAGKEFVIQKFVYGCRPGNPFSDWFIELNSRK